MSSSPSTSPDIALDFKSATLYAVRVVLHTHDTSSLIAALTRRMTEAGAFFEHEPVVIDAQALQQSPDWAALLDQLRAHHLHPIGVTASGAVLADAQTHGLSPVDISAAPPRIAPAPSQDIPPPPPRAAANATTPNPASPPAHAAEPTIPPAAMIVRHPLRSGQRIYAKGTDLIVIGMVSQGAEVIADGNIHVYGPLRGKAMAGARGDTQAMILTTQLDPELLAIAGVYRVVETRLSDNVHNQPAQVVLDGDTLKIRPLQRHSSNL